MLMFSIHICLCLYCSSSMGGVLTLEMWPAGRFQFYRQNWPLSVKWIPAHETVIWLYLVQKQSDPILNLINFKVDLGLVSVMFSSVWGFIFM